MNAPLHRRVAVANCWATSRIAVLDTQERYEDSYAIAEEFREWITCIGEDPEYLEAYYFRGILGFSMERLSGSSIDSRACKDIKKAYKNNFPDAINYVDRNKTFLKEDKCYRIFN